MGQIIAIAGKGGVGKTTIAALLARYLIKQKKGALLAVDADPNSNLGETMGIASYKDIGSLIEDISRNIDKIPLNTSKDEFISYQIETIIEENRGFDLLAMGRPEGPGCYCYINNVLRQKLTKLISSYAYVIIDNEAGFEHLSRKIVKKIDTLLVISDSTNTGIKAAKRIFNLTKELGIQYKQAWTLVNKVAPQKNKDAEIENSIPLKNIGFILENNDISCYANAGKIMDLEEKEPIIQETNKIFSKIF